MIRSPTESAPPLQRLRGAAFPIRSAQNHVDAPNKLAERIEATAGRVRRAGRKKGQKTSDRIQITLRVKPKTAAELRAEAEQRLEEERRLRPQRKRPNIGKVLDDLAEHL